MIFMFAPTLYKKFTKLAVFFSILIFLNQCGLYKKTDARKVPTNANDRIKKNMEEGRGFRLGKLGKNSGGNFQFASSNSLWRATLEKLDFIPLANVDYAGGVIITDWYGDTQSDEEIKVAVRFLTNEIRSDALDVVIYKRKCVNTNRCKTTKVENNTNIEIKASILKRAAALSKEAESKKK